ncbi:NADP-dependent oxidoreductase [Catellatospora bangladeshensis]|uniref:NADPH:quinone reductase n=1 Tax=Catellatospora bangladeshensis TaxID=310355 RepID=A0A8J3JWD8_9ACTN|nr:NADP-dependent oxidoreductase [Catellatospora bangladeshensis]GIF86355.1 NADPH:quinone reductase [Catellatospora bangladeshensis]
MTEHMLAVRQDSLGGPEVLRVAEVARPSPGPTEVLVRVHAAGVNPVDWKVRRRGGAFGEPPFTVGWDVSGEVAAIGAGVTRFAVGDEVFGMPRFPMAAGAYAQYVTSPSRQLARKPAGLDHVHAAALPLAALTAWQALVDTARVAEGQRVLVHAAAGGVGHLAVQIAKARGAYVIGTARAEKHDLLRELGVDEPVDYTAVDFAQAVKDVDVVLDTVGGDYEDRSLRTLRPGGILVGILNAGSAAETAAKAQALGVRGTGMLVEPDHTGLEQIAALVEAGLLRPLVAATFPLAEAAQAHELGEAGRTTGKIVLTVPQD